ncbi:MAG: hypothetical protein COA36_10345 [Desulfotalea sp.]|nr:MAG: hypothetical protein COA36_10345 [Desulfotalea sp.]
MKKIIASALGLMLVGGVAASTASAVENQFGGYWRTRAFVQDEFTPGESTWRIDNRTRLYYTAKFNDDFKFVNKFEFNSIWGDDQGGDIGSDGSTWKVKHSYIDANFGTTRVKLGIQGTVIARGFLFDDDFSGAMVTADFGGVSVTPFYAAVSTEDGGNQDFDQHLFGVVASVKISDAISLTPFVVYNYADSAMVMTDDVEVLEGDIENLYVGTDFDMQMDAVSVWGTFIYNGYTIQDVDGDAFLGALGVDAGIAHGQAFYATGDDAFVSAPGQSYYWSEILGYGVFDNEAVGGVGDQISNVMALNAGVTLKPMDKLKIDADIWYAMLAEDNAAGDDELGLEFDGKLTYALMDNLNAELILAYLVAGDAVGDDDVFEGGVRVSLKF